MNTTPFVFFGTPYVARDTLEILHQHGYTPSLVVTSPDRPRGRGLHLTPSEAKEWALSHNIPVISPEKITSDVIAEIASYSTQYGLAVAYGKILPRTLIESFPLGILNIHYSLLPKYRGASPVEAALLAGDTVTGVAIQQMIPALDAGDILALQEVPIEPTETTRELRPRLVTLGANLLVSILPSFIEGSISRTAQDEHQASHVGKIAKEKGQLDLNGDALTNWNTYRAYAESPGTYFFVTKNGRMLRVKIKTASYANGVFTPNRIIPEGKSEMEYADFIKALS